MEIDGQTNSPRPHAATRSSLAATMLRDAATFASVGEALRGRIWSEASDLAKRRS